MIENLAKSIRSTNVEPKSIAIWGLGQMGLCIKDADQRVLLIDPILSDVVAETFPENAAMFQRAFDAPILPHEIDFADVVLCTHEHLDHADPQTLAGILQASPQAQCYTSHWAIEVLRETGLDTSRMHVAMPGKFFNQGLLTIHSIPSAHYEVEVDPQKGSRWLGFVLDWDWMRLYHSGDTILYPGLLDALNPFPPIRVMMLPVNGRDAKREAMDIIGNLHLAEAQQLAGAMQTETVLVGHNDLFIANSVPLDQQETLKMDSNVPQALFFELLPGQQITYRKG